jgi:hypothetical protein
MNAFAAARLKFRASWQEAVKRSRQETVDGAEERNGSRDLYASDVAPNAGALTKDAAALQGAIANSVRSADELGQLSETFNGMLGKAQISIEAYNDMRAQETATAAEQAREVAREGVLAAEHASGAIRGVADSSAQVAGAIEDLSAPRSPSSPRPRPSRYRPRRSRPAHPHRRSPRPPRSWRAPPSSCRSSSAASR